MNYSLAMFYAQQNEMERMSEYLRRAIELRPDYAEARNNLGVLLVRQRDYAQAEEQFTTCIRLVPGFDQSYINLARLYVVENNKQEAGKDSAAVATKAAPKRGSETSAEDAGGRCLMGIVRLIAQLAYEGCCRAVIDVVRGCLLLPFSIIGIVYELSSSALPRLIPLFAERQSYRGPCYSAVEMERPCALAGRREHADDLCGAVC